MPISGRIVGYGRLVERPELNLPPLFELHAVADKQIHAKRDGRVVHPSPRRPGDGVLDHRIFALKYEG